MLACAYAHSLYPLRAHHPFRRGMFPRLHEWRKRQFQGRRLPLRKRHDGLPHGARLGHGDDAGWLDHRAFLGGRADGKIQRQRRRGGRAHAIASLPARRRTRQRAHGHRPRGRRPHGELRRARQGLCAADAAQPRACRRGGGARVSRAEGRPARTRSPHAHARRAALFQRRRGRLCARPQRHAEDRRAAASSQRRSTSAGAWPPSPGRWRSAAR